MPTDSPNLPALQYLANAPDEVLPPTVDNVHWLNDAAVIEFCDRSYRIEGILSLAFAGIFFFYAMLLSKFGKVFTYGTFACMALGCMIAAIGVWVLVRPPRLAYLITFVTNSLAVIAFLGWNIAMSGVLVGLSSSWTMVFPLAAMNQKLRLVFRYRDAMANAPSRATINWIGNLLKTGTVNADMDASKTMHLFRSVARLYDTPCRLEFTGELAVLIDGAMPIHFCPVEDFRAERVDYASERIIVTVGDLKFRAKPNHRVKVVTTNKAQDGS